MAFQSRGTQQPAQSGKPASPSMNNLVDQIADAVRERLIQQGVPLQPSSQTGQPTPSTVQPSPWQHLVQEGADRLGHAAGESPFQPHVLQGDSALAGKIDHTLLKPEATLEEIKHVCEEARKYHFATVCVNSVYAGTVA